MKSCLRFLPLVLIVTSLSSCLKNNLGPSQSPGAVLIVHASPNAPNIDMYVDGARSLYNISYGSDTGYAIINPGTYSFAFTQTGNTTPLVTQSFTFEGGKLYSIFTIDSVSKMKAVYVADNIATISLDSVQIRYFDLSPDAPFHTAVITSGTDSVQYTIRGFNDQGGNSDFQNFTSLKAGTYDLKLSQPGSGTPFKVFNNLVLTGGKVYTIYLKGFYNGSGTQALGVGFARHN